MIWIQPEFVLMRAFMSGCMFESLVCMLSFSFTDIMNDHACMCILLNLTTSSIIHQEQVGGAE